MKAVEIYQQICEVYEQNIMSDGMAHKWLRAFKGGSKNVHDEKWSGRLTVITNDLVHKINKKEKMNRRFTISALSDEFP